MDLNKKQPGFSTDLLPRYLQKTGVEYHILEQDIHIMVKEKIQGDLTYCDLCA